MKLAYIQYPFKKSIDNISNTHSYAVSLKTGIEFFKYSSGVKVLHISILGFTFIFDVGK